MKTAEQRPTRKIRARKPFHYIIGIILILLGVLSIWPAFSAWPETASYLAFTFSAGCFLLSHFVTSKYEISFPESDQ